MSDKAKKIKKHLLVRSRLLNRYLNLHDKITSLFLAVFIGILIAIAAILFRYLIQFAQYYALGDGSVNNFEYLGTLEWWKILLSTVSGGIITISELRDFYQKELPDKDVKASDIYRILPFYLKPTDTLEHAFRIFDQTGEDILAIVSEDESENIIGILSYRDVLRAYNKLFIDARENT